MSDPRLNHIWTHSGARRSTDIEAHDPTAAASGGRHGIDRVTRCESSSVPGSGCPAVSGFVNSVGFVVLFGVFMTGATGNVGARRRGLGDELWREAARFGLPIAMLFVTASLALGAGYVLRRRGRDPVPADGVGRDRRPGRPRGARVGRRRPRAARGLLRPYYVFLLLRCRGAGLQYALVHLTGPPERVSTVVVGIHVIHGATSAAHWIDARFRRRHARGGSVAAARQATRRCRRRVGGPPRHAARASPPAGGSAVVLVRRSGMWSLDGAGRPSSSRSRSSGQHRQVERPETDTDVSPA